jgi:acetyl/propionyl-CoA carboxylase alpha subunit
VRVSNSSDDRIAVVSLGNGRYQVTQGATRRIAFAVGGRDTWVFLDGRTYLVSDAAEDSKRRSRVDEEAALVAPMPATVLAVHAAQGERVERSQVVMVLEAMKMELPIRAPRDGVVKSVGCQVGDLVQPGATLLELEDSDPALHDKDPGGDFR